MDLHGMLHIPWRYIDGVLWQDPMRVEVPARTMDEARWLVIGRMGGKHWSAVVTYREDSVRIISVRRARDEEIRIYEV
jgi:uncharacterized DUF497 family protein